MKPEVELAIVLCRTPLTQRQRARANSVVSLATDWDFFFAYAARAQVEPAALSNLLTLDRETIPQHVCDTAEARALEARAVSLSRTLVMNDLLRRFDSLKIPTIVLKGAATGVTCYGDPSLRTFGDVDLLVRSADIRRARAALLESDYVPSYDLAVEDRLLQAGHALELSSANAKVELHSVLISRYLRLDFDLASVWETSRVVMCAGQEIRVLAKDVEFLFLAAHGAKHEWMQLRWLVDIAQLAETLTDDESSQLVALASGLHARGLLATALQSVERVFESVPRSEVLRAASQPGNPNRRIGSVLRHVEVETEVPSPSLPRLARLHPGLPMLLFWISTRERFRDRIACVVNVVLKGTGVDQQPLGVRLLRPVWLAVRAARRAAMAS